MARLADESHFLYRLDELFKRLDAETKIVPAERKHIRALADFSHARLYTAALAYMRGQRSESLGLARGGIEAAINAYLLHKGAMTDEVFEKGGRGIDDVYRTVNNQQHENYLSTIQPLFETRKALSRWGAHPEYGNVVFRLTQVGETAQFSYFDISDDDNEFKFYFVTVVYYFTNVLDVFLAIAGEQGDEWIDPLAVELLELRDDIIRHNRERLGYLKESEPE
jgi:hypothetical protein